MPQTDLMPCEAQRMVCMLAKTLKNLTYDEAVSALDGWSERLPLLISDFQQLYALVMVVSKEANTALLTSLKSQLTTLLNDGEKILAMAPLLELQGIKVILDAYGPQALYDRLSQSSQIQAYFACIHPDARSILLHHLGERLVHVFRTPKSLNAFLALQNAEDIYTLYIWYEAANPNFAQEQGPIFLAQLVACCDKAPGPFSLANCREVLARFAVQKIVLHGIQHELSLSTASSIFEAMGSQKLFSRYPTLSTMMAFIQGFYRDDIRLCLLLLVKWQLCQQTHAIEDMILILAEASTSFATLYFDTLGWDRVDKLILTHEKRMQLLGGISLESTRVIAQKCPTLLVKAAVNIQHIADIMPFIDAPSADRILLKEVGPYLHRYYTDCTELHAALQFLGDAKQMVILRNVLHTIAEIHRNVRDWLALLCTLENQSATLIIQFFHGPIISSVRTEGDKNALLARFVLYEPAYHQLQGKTYSTTRFFKPFILPERDAIKRPEYSGLQ